MIFFQFFHGFSLLFFISGNSTNNGSSALAANLQKKIEEIHPFISSKLFFLFLPTWKFLYKAATGLPMVNIIFFTIKQSLLPAYDVF